MRTLSPSGAIVDPTSLYELANDWERRGRANVASIGDDRSRGRKAALVACAAELHTVLAAITEEDPATVSDLPEGCIPHPIDSTLICWPHQSAPQPDPTVWKHVNVGRLSPMQRIKPKIITERIDWWLCKGRKDVAGRLIIGVGHSTEGGRYYITEHARWSVDPDGTIDVQPKVRQ